MRTMVNPPQKVILTIQTIQLMYRDQEVEDKSDP